VDGVDTGRPGCGDHGFGVIFCHVGEACTNTSTYTEGIKTRSCDEFQDNLADKCLPCRMGQSSAGGDACTPCAAGSYAATNGTATCSLCEPGKVNGGEGATGCSECAREVPAGSTSCPAPFVEGGYLDMKAKFGNGAVSEEAVREAGIDAFVVRAGRYARVERGRRAKRGR
jgi:hypothetical protein